jgi:hypothetical protein
MDPCSSAPGLLPYRPLHRRSRRPSAGSKDGVVVSSRQGQSLCRIQPLYHMSGDVACADTKGAGCYLSVYAEGRSQRPLQRASLACVCKHCWESCCIGNSNRLFPDARNIAGPGELSISLSASQVDTSLDRHSNRCRLDCAYLERRAMEYRCEARAWHFRPDCPSWPRQLNLIIQEVFQRITRSALSASRCATSRRSRTRNSQISPPGRPHLHWCESRS